MVNLSSTDVMDGRSVMIVGVPVKASEEEILFGRRPLPFFGSPLLLIVRWRIEGLALLWGGVTEDRLSVQVLAETALLVDSSRRSLCSITVDVTVKGADVGLTLISRI
jgi:hypothetical protein